MNLDIRHSDPQRMTARARAYLTVAAIRGIVVGFACLSERDYFRQESFTEIRNLLPGEFFTWGLLFLAAGVTCTVAAIFRDEAAAYLGLILSASATGAWAFGFIAAAAHGHLSGPTGITFVTSCAIYDVIVCRQPLRTPFEGLVQTLRRG